MSFFYKMNEEKIKTSHVLYMRRIGAYGRDNYILMNNFKDWLKANNLFCDDTVILAVPLDDPNITDPQKCRYDVCMIDVAARKIETDEVKSRQIDGGKYVIFLIAHTPEAVQRAWIECFGELRKHGYSYDASRPVMERYAKKLVDNHYCELCVPIL